MEIKITYRWWRSDNETDDITYSRHDERLRHSALERIFESAQQGCGSGELLEEIDGINYNGWFETETMS